MSTPTDAEPHLSTTRWFTAGMRAFFSLPAFILMAAFTGFGGLAHASGVTLAQAVAMSGLIWALPSMVVLVGAIKAGTPILATAIAVSLSAVRLMPMTMALTPILRDEKTPRWQLYWASHFVAVTAWVFGMTKLPSMARAARVPYFVGFAMTLTVVNMGVTAVSWWASAALPPVAAAALVLLTPLYFIVSLWRAAERAPTDRIALVIGMAIMPGAHHLTPEFALLLTGLLGGSIAFVLARLLRRRPAAAAGTAAADLPADVAEEER
ncbi:MAG: AzlC family ABC transporter permease [Siculibacillus sp.]|nr:AzlC family ABC transporter permease [Siculibacillus sp.]